MMLRRWAAHYANPTPAEAALEPALASLGVPYRFQYPVWALGVFPDFTLIRDRVIIEVDDKSHNTKSKRAADAERTARLLKLGWKAVVRCTNEAALADPYRTVDTLMEAAGLPYRTRNPNV